MEQAAAVGRGCGPAGRQRAANAVLQEGKYFEVREALLQAGRAGLVGGGKEAALHPTDPVIGAVMLVVN